MSNEIMYFIIGIVCFILFFFVKELIFRWFEFPKLQKLYNDACGENIKLIKQIKDLKEDFENKINLLNYSAENLSEENNKNSEIQKDKIEKLIKEKNEYKKELEIINKKFEILKQETPNKKLFNLIENLVSRELKQADKISDYLFYKIQPAKSLASEIKSKFSKLIKEYKSEYLKMKYQYELLLDIFPELKEYFEMDAEDETIEDVKNDYDYAKDWLSKEEYEKLDEDERNQKALENYIKNHHKTKWQIGRDYEIFIGYELQEKGYKVDYTGSKEKLKDLGRDLIAENDNEILIVQCKCWSKEKVIHEKHICQLYGTAIQYILENKPDKKVIPMFVTKTKLSETAKKFSEYLNIKILENKELEEFPRIKCNINKGEKIYHLPFDQQYDRTIIEKEKGEFFAFTVKEATSLGFRRAKKYFNV